MEQEFSVEDVIKAAEDAGKAIGEIYTQDVSTSEQTIMCSKAFLPN